MAEELVSNSENASTHQQDPFDTSDLLQQINNVEEEQQVAGVQSVSSQFQSINPSVDVASSSAADSAANTHQQDPFDTSDLLRQINNMDEQQQTVTNNQHNNNNTQQQQAEHQQPQFNEVTSSTAAVETPETPHSQQNVRTMSDAEASLRQRHQLELQEIATEFSLWAAQAEQTEEDHIELQEFREQKREAKARHEQEILQLQAVEGAVVVQQNQVVGQDQVALFVRNIRDKVDHSQHGKQGSVHGGGGLNHSQEQQEEDSQMLMQGEDVLTQEQGALMQDEENNQQQHEQQRQQQQIIDQQAQNPRQIQTVVDSTQIGLQVTAQQAQLSQQQQQTYNQQEEIASQQAQNRQQNQTETVVDFAQTNNQQEQNQQQQIAFQQTNQEHQNEANQEQLRIADEEDHLRQLASVLAFVELQHTAKVEALRAEERNYTWWEDSCAEMEQLSQQWTQVHESFTNQKERLRALSWKQVQGLPYIHQLSDYIDKEIVVKGHWQQYLEFIERLQQVPQQQLEVANQQLQSVNQHLINQQQENINQQAQFNQQISTQQQQSFQLQETEQQAQTVVDLARFGQQQPLQEQQQTNTQQSLLTQQQEQITNQQAHNPQQQEEEQNMDQQAQNTQQNQTVVDLTRFGQHQTQQEQQSLHSQQQDQNNQQLGHFEQQLEYLMQQAQIPNQPNPQTVVDLTRLGQQTQFIQSQQQQIDNQQLQTASQQEQNPQAVVDLALLGQQQQQTQQTFGKQQEITSDQQSQTASQQEQMGNQQTQNPQTVVDLALFGQQQQQTFGQQQPITSDQQAQFSHQQAEQSLLEGIRLIQDEEEDENMEQETDIHQNIVLTSKQVHAVQLATQATLEWHQVTGMKWSIDLVLYYNRIVVFSNDSDMRMTVC